MGRKYYFMFVAHTIPLPKVQVIQDDGRYQVYKELCNMRIILYNYVLWGKYYTNLGGNMNRKVPQAKLC
jgi:hypothetical protein